MSDPSEKPRLRKFIRRQRSHSVQCNGAWHPDHGVISNDEGKVPIRGCSHRKHHVGYNSGSSSSGCDEFGGSGDESVSNQSK